MSTVTQILNWISNSLLLPVIVLLLAALVLSLISLGGFCASYIMLLQERRKRIMLLEKIRKSSNFREEDLSDDGIFSGHLRRMFQFQFNELECEKYITETELEYERDLERSKFLTKVGPMLGLMGTLIPMGPALAGLASGDIANMAYNMQIAFATTVVGCVIAGIALLVYSVKKHWYVEEISNLRYVLDRKLEEEHIS
ncbi:MAG: MotA/TolQ/ExbB proton channel family protein [Lentisphaeria bacterium]|nr:MotA/TolQ/ExbB proton channel family protein [Lentisphaeria bacterium]